MNRVTAEQITAEFLELDRSATLLEMYWNELCPEIQPRPDRPQFKRWVCATNADLEPYKIAFARASVKQQTKAFNDDSHSVRWISSVANRLSKERAA